MPAAFGSISPKVATAAANSIVVTCPTGTVTGDLMLLFAGNGNVAAWTTPTGWTVIDQPATSGDTGSACWYKIATSGDTAGTTTYTISESGAPTADSSPVAAIVRYQNFDATQFPLAAAKHGVTHGTTPSATSGVPPALTPGANDLVVRCYVMFQDSSTTTMTLSGAPTGWTQRGQNTTPATTATYTGPSQVASQFNGGMVICDKVAGSDSLTVTSNVTGDWDVYALIIPQPNVPTANLSDDFNAGSIDTVKWPNNFANGAQTGPPAIPAGTLPTQTGGKATFNTLGLAGYGSADKYKLAGSSFYAQVVPETGSNAATGSFTSLTYYVNPPAYSQFLRFTAEATDGVLRMKYIESGTTVFNATVPYDPVQHAWLRIRESAGTLFFDAAPNGIAWVTVGTQSTPANIAAAGGGEIDLEATNPNSSTATIATFDNLNIAQTPPVYQQRLPVGQAVARASFR